ncbi:hypothetical protein V1477_018107, partial [Vespula maculifrons]
PYAVTDFGFRPGFQARRRKHDWHLHHRYTQSIQRASGNTKTKKEKEKKKKKKRRNRRRRRRREEEAEEEEEEEATATTTTSSTTTTTTTKTKTASLSLFIPVGPSRARWSACWVIVAFAHSRVHYCETKFSRYKLRAFYREACVILMRGYRRRWYY